MGCTVSKDFQVSESMAADKGPPAHLGSRDPMAGWARIFRTLDRDRKDGQGCQQGWVWATVLPTGYLGHFAKALLGHTTGMTTGIALSDGDGDRRPAQKAVMCGLGLNYGHSC